LTQIRIELKLDLTQLSQIRLKLVDLLYNSPAWLKTHSDGADVTAMTRSSQSSSLWTRETMFALPIP